MHISKKNREIVKNKFGGKCAYTGTELLPDWQVDHVNAVRRNWWLNNSALNEENHNIENMVPCQRSINLYKFTYDLEGFRHFMMDFHNRLKKLPKKPKNEKSIRHKKNLLEIARLFDITPEKPFSGKFYFEKISK
jgi:hypothetical protein